VVLGEANGRIEDDVVARAQMGNKEGILEFFIDAAVFECLRAQQVGIDHRDGDGLFGDESPRLVPLERKGLELAVGAVEACAGRGNAEGFFEPQADAALVGGEGNGMRGAQQTANARFGFGQRNANGRGGRNGRSHLGRKRTHAHTVGMRRFQFFRTF